LFAELGACHVFSKPQMAAERQDEAPIYLREIITNIFLWGQPIVATENTAGNQ
jgi:hypothetical protein